MSVITTMPAAAFELDDALQEELARAFDRAVTLEQQGLSLSFERGRFGRVHASLVDARTGERKPMSLRDALEFACA